MAQSKRRTLLYYPTITVPSGAWLKRAVLYGDEVASIVPHAVDDTPATPYTQDVAYLRDEGEFRPIRPESLVMRRWEQLDLFEGEFQALIASSGPKKKVRNQKPLQLDAKIHYDKVSARTFSFLVQRGLARPEPVYEARAQWFVFERRTASLYMSLLAKYLAGIDEHLVTPTTDRRFYQDSVYLAKRDDNSELGVELLFKNIIPVPRSDVPLRRIVEFKRQRRAELLRFRALVDKFQSDVAAAQGSAAIRDVTIRFSEQVELGVSDLAATMSDSRLSIAVGSLRSIVSITSPTFWSTAGVVAGKATNVANLPVAWTCLGLAGMGAVEVGFKYLEARNERRGKLRGSAYSYLYHARELT
jgi:hypothetical protein